MDGHYVRTGKNVFPVKNDIADLLDFQVPKYNPAFNLSFAEVTDKRCADLRKTHFERPWKILYSGGIDSTVIIVSILKNLSKEDWSNVEILCNRISIYENPKFFYDYIKPNFTIKDFGSLYYTDNTLKNCYIFDGEPADQLYGGHSSRNFYGDAILKNWRTDPDELINLYALKVNRSFAEWYYEVTKENIKSSSVPIETYYDFTWWQFFNFCWIPIKWRSLYYQNNQSPASLELFLNGFIPWYKTIEYQHWSMVNRFGIKYNTGINDRKLASKKYIYDFDHDEYYFQFKTKMESTARVIPNSSGFFCITDDLRRLSFDKNLDEILELLPAHINVQ
jgi:hypothetical protein